MSVIISCRWFTLSLSFSTWPESKVYKVHCIICDHCHLSVTYCHLYCWHLMSCVQVQALVCLSVRTFIQHAWPVNLCAQPSHDMWSVCFLLGLALSPCSAQLHCLCTMFTTDSSFIHHCSNHLPVCLCVLLPQATNHVAHSFHEYHGSTKQQF